MIAVVNSGAYEAVGGPVEGQRRHVFAEFDLLYSVATLITGDRSTAKRVLPAVMKAAFRDRGSYHSDEGVRAWLLGLMLTELTTLSPDEWSSAPPAVVENTPTVAPVSDPSLRFAAVAIRKGILMLSRTHREILALGDVAGLSYDQLAAVLGMSRSEVRNRLHVARSVLKGVLISGTDARFA